MNRFANLADKSKASPKSQSQPPAPGTQDGDSATGLLSTSPKSNSRAGRKAIAAYFTPEMSLAMHFCARKQGLSLSAVSTNGTDLRL